MAEFLRFFLPLVALLLSPVLMPLVGWLAGTLKDVIVGQRHVRRSPPDDTREKGTAGGRDRALPEVGG
ncbi:hypothetical protein [Haloechinothrix halophila]|uniref:hypothetical protein n=1 Tax=Haloechinothrix halophila TaxID=1069073 RepID=UPI0003F8E9B4|nr:hypothetical protein [Haloechinothrix halophila]